MAKAGYGARRSLTNGEIALASKAFGEQIDYPRIRFQNGAGRNPVAMVALRRNGAITLRQAVFFRQDHYLDDFAAGQSADVDLLIHELTHVWQYRRLGVPRFLARYGREFAAAGFNAKRMYEYKPGVTRFADAMLEAQAAMVGNYAGAGADARKLLGVNLEGSGMFGL